MNRGKLSRLIRRVQRKSTRLIHRAKITGGQMLYPALNFLYHTKLGSAARLCQTLASSQNLPGCSSSLLLYPAPIPLQEPQYFVPGSIEQEYLKKLRFSGQDIGRFSCPAGIISARNVSVSLPTGMHVWNGRVFDEALLDPGLLTNPKYIIALEEMPFRRKRVISEPVVLLTMPWHHNLYHWIIEILPRLFLYDLSSDINTLRLVVPKSAPEYVTESLAMAGYLDRVLFLDDGVYQFEQLHLLSRLSPARMASSTSVKWLNEKLTRPRSAKRLRTYVSRSDAKYRFVSNEIEVESVLAEFGFRRIVLSDYSLEEKIRIFQESEVVLGSSGAGFTGAAFMEPGSVFMEFFPNGHFADCFYNLACLRGLKYGFMVGKQDGLGFSIDTAQLRRVLEQVLNDQLEAQVTTAASKLES